MDWTHWLTVGLLVVLPVAVGVSALISWERGRQRRGRP